MKRYFNLILLCLALLLTVVSACKKNVEQIFLEGGNAPKLTASVSGTIPLFYASQSEPAVTLNWTNPNYRFTTGPSSHDVNYTIEIDTTGGNFSSPIKKTLSIKSDLSQRFTQKELNLILINDMSLAIGKSHNIELRVMSGLGSVLAAPLVSNVLKFTVTPYQDPTLLPPDLFMTGDATTAGWTNAPPDNQKLTYLGSKKYEIVTALVPGKQYKFLSKFGQWQPQYGSASSSGGSLQVNDGTSTDPPSINTPAVAGNYKIAVDLGAMTYTITKV